MKTLLQMEMYYVREYTSTCRFLKIINSTLTNLQLGCILHYVCSPLSLLLHTGSDVHPLLVPHSRSTGMKSHSESLKYSSPRSSLLGTASMKKCSGMGGSV